MSIVDTLNAIDAIFREVRAEQALRARNQALRREQEVYAVSDSQVVSQSIACVGFNAMESKGWAF